MSMQGSRPYLVHRSRRRINTVITGVLSLLMLIVVGLTIAVRGSDRFCKLHGGPICPPPVAASETIHQ